MRHPNQKLNMALSTRKRSTRHFNKLPAHEYASGVLNGIYGRIMSGTIVPDKFDNF